MPCGSPRSWPSCASATARGSATSTSTATSSPRSRRSPPTPRSRPSWPASASGCATPRACARRRAARTRPAAGADEDGGGAAARAGPGGVAGCSRSPASTRGSTRSRERLAALAVELDDVAAELRDYAEGIEADPGRLLAVEERLEALDRLLRKHGGSVESVLAHAERCREEIARLEGAEERGAEAEAALAEAEARREKLAAELSAARAKAAAPLEKRVAKELEQLAMPGASLEVVLDPNPDGFGAGGRGVGRAEDGAEPGDRGGAAPRRGLRRRALAGDARPLRPPARPPAARPWSSTRSTPGSAATPPASSASGCAPWARAAR